MVVQLLPNHNSHNASQLSCPFSPWIAVQRLGAEHTGEQSERGRRQNQPVRNKSQHSFHLMPSFPLLPKLEPSAAQPSTVPGGPADVELQAQLLLHDQAAAHPKSQPSGLQSCPPTTPRYLCAHLASHSPHLHTASPLVLQSCKDL